MNTPFFEQFHLLHWCSVVESKLTFFDKQVEVLFGDSVVFSEHPFCLVPKILNAVNVVMFLLGKMRTVVDAVVVESRYIQSVVTTVAISINNAVRRYFSDDNRH